MFLGSLALAFIGLLVGFGCVLLPPFAPLGVVSIAAVLLLWVIPDVQAVPIRWLNAIYGPYIVSIIAVPVIYGVILPGLPWLSIRRLALFGMLTPLCLTLAGSSSSRRFVADCLSRLPVLKCCLIGFLTVMALSTLTSVGVAQAINEDINFILIDFLPMVAAILVIRSNDKALVIFRIAAACVCTNFVIGAIEFYLKHPFLIYALPSSMRDLIMAENPLAHITYIVGQGERNGLYRAASIFTNSLTWGEASAMLVPMCLHFVAHGRSGFERCYGAAAVALGMLSVILSGARGAYVGMIAALGVYSLVFAIRACRVNRKSLLASIWLFLCTIGLGVTALMIMFVPRFHNTVLGGGKEQYATDARFAQWDLAQPKILARPFLGYGNGSAAEVIHFSMGGPTDPISIDGFFMNLLVDFGIPGFLFYSILFFGAVFMCFRTYIFSDNIEESWGAALGASLVAFIIYRITLSSSENIGLAFIVLGMAFAYYNFTRSRNGQSPSRAA